MPGLLDPHTSWRIPYWDGPRPYTNWYFSQRGGLG